MTMRTRPLAAVRRGVLGVLVGALVLLTGCASLPESSAPQALGTLDREPTSDGPPPPISGRDPDLLLRDFLQATATPANRHEAARQYLTASASTRWDDAAGTVIVEKPDTLRESRGGDAATYVIRARKVGELSADGSYRPSDGSMLENKIEMTRVGGEWRIDELPDGVVMDNAAFAKAYQRHALYFLDPNGSSLVPDLRWVSVPPAQRTQRLLDLLLDGPQPALTENVRTVVAPPVALRGAVTKANGDPEEVGVGLGGVRIDLAGAAALAPRDRELLAAQVVATLSAAEVLGPYVLLADGKALDDRFAANGWSVADIEQYTPDAHLRNKIGLFALRNGTLMQVRETGITPVPGYFGAVNNLQSAALSEDGQLVAAVAGDAGRATLMVGSYGGDAFPVAEGATISRPTWNSDGSAAWAVVNGERVVRAAADRATGTVSKQDVDISALTAVTSALSPRLPITELRISGSGVRAALIADGKVYVAVVERRPDGRYAFTAPQPLAVGLSTRAVSLSWLSGDTIIIAREGNVDPVVTVSIDGSEQITQTSQNLTPPMRVVSAALDTWYVADSRAVLQLQYGQPVTTEGFWREVPGLTGENVVPVLPG
ncbi:MtrAB system accessory lipoprotein LpqB [Nocardia asteroides]|uniref:MtrAB system accessory lipoprotein LpqB n=1 Tax=Nocardia asteroides TaxID=1824 RepID=UPI001E4CAB99|nr:MtrAB system accessory lipoprotein LpqB [Nocardia asteroides]UGT64112.1 MtrAB system accessory lipoprotein LpqB [Nocardia asteroides]